MDRLSTRVSPPDRAPGWTAWLVAAMTATVALYGIDIVVHPLAPAASDLLKKYAAGSVFFGAATLCAVKARSSRDERFAWWSFALAMTLWGTASLYFAVILWDRASIPYPSVADGFWLAFYVPAYGALLSLLRRRAGGARRSVWLDALVGGLGVGGAGAAVAFQAVLAHGGGTALATATNLAYPVGDLGLLALVVGAITVTGWKASGPWRWIAPALAIFVVADSIYLVQVANGTYELGTIFDLGWPVAALLVGLAAWRPQERVDPAASVQDAILVPALSGLAALALLVVDHFVRANPVAVALATASILIILVRLYLTVQDNTRLLAHSREEAMTDALTGLGNRRQLTADLAARLGRLDAARPLVLTLFDLDGFKHYNDTFGHPAGDQLLTRLGGRLRDLMAQQGMAYRMGGDEFCVLWTCADADEASIITMEAAAVAALSEQARRSRSRRPTAPCGCRWRRQTPMRRCGRRTAGCTSASAAGGRPPPSRAPTSCSGRWLNATPSSTSTSAAWPTSHTPAPCGWACPRRMRRRPIRPRCCTTSARSRSPTRFSTSRVRWTAPNGRSCSATRSSASGSSRPRRRCRSSRSSCAPRTSATTATGTRMRSRVMRSR